MATAAQRIVHRLEQLAHCTDDPPRLTRVAYSQVMRRAHELVGGWMREAGLEVRVDPVGNLIGRVGGGELTRQTLMLGSHLDTVRNAGRFDGALGVLLAIECVEGLRGRDPGFDLEVLGFIDEEGVRFQSTYLGSRALAGTLSERDLEVRDAEGVSLGDAIREFTGCRGPIDRSGRNSASVLGYLEAHIEQGPVLEVEDLPVGIVTAIAGQSRARVTFVGEAGHAGTVPMELRRDALAAAAAFVTQVEQLARDEQGLVATIGELSVKPGASNVIPGEAELTLDVRHPNDEARLRAMSSLRRTANEIASSRKLTVCFDVRQETQAVTCSAKLNAWLENAIAACGLPVKRLASGAGHDAAALATMYPVAMLFVRCRKGFSHHPDEFASEADIAVALEVMKRFILGRRT